MSRRWRSKTRGKVLGKRYPKRAEKCVIAMAEKKVRHNDRGKRDRKTGRTMAKRGGIGGGTKKGRKFPMG